MNLLFCSAQTYVQILCNICARFFFGRKDDLYNSSAASTIQLSISVDRNNILSNRKPCRLLRVQWKSVEILLKRVDQIVECPSKGAEQARL